MIKFWKQVILPYRQIQILRNQIQNMKKRVRQLLNNPNLEDHIRIIEVLLICINSEVNSKLARLKNYEQNYIKN